MTSDGPQIKISPHRGGEAVARTSSGRLRLCAEQRWLVEGDDELVRQVEAALPPFCERVGQALLVRFGNAVGSFDGGPLGRLQVHSDKWGEADFDAMLSAITRRMMLLPFSAGTGAEAEHERAIATEHQVLYHAFVYARHLVGDATPREDRLVPAVRLVLAQPHRRLERVATWLPLHAVERLDPRALLGAVTPRAELTRAPPRRAIALAAALGGYLPRHVEQTKVQSTVDLPENQFVKAFLDQVLAVVEQMRALVISVGDGHFRRRILADCDAIDRSLVPLRRHALWDEVSQMRRIPAESQVLQRRRGYRETLRHFVRMRLAARLPLRPEATRHLLELKDIAELYEMWSFFEVERQVSLALDRPPVNADLVDVGPLGARLGRGLRVAWDGGIELFYNLSYSRNRHDRSYSVALRPDIVLRLASGPNAGDHLFDAKFKVRRVEDAMHPTDDIDESTQTAERRGVFKQADLYKMHTYRDAIPSARTVWILYPGTTFRFFDEQAGPLDDVDRTPPTPTGVGAIPLQPGTSTGTVTNLVRRLVG